MPLRFQPLEIPEVVLVMPEVFCDDRGGLFESFRKSAFEAAGIDVDFVQENQLQSDSGVLRGLNYQLAPHAQGRLVQVLTGSIYDVALDLRVGSPTYGAHVSRTLTASRPELLWIPAGFAHGVAFLESETRVAYKASHSEYTPSAKRSIRWNDPALGIDWPISQPVLSEQDRQAPSFDEAEKNTPYSPTARTAERGRISGRVTVRGTKTNTQSKLLQ